jgi:alginate O-acetyltransferase complex protein AlgI
MLFNSIDFAIFLPIVFMLYWFIFNKNLKIQNTFIAVVSYVFYGWWDWRFLVLILFSTFVDYLVGLKLYESKNLTKRKILLWVSILVNLGLLGFFKYYNFFIDNFKSAFTFFGSDINVNTLNIILPVGISFYTFQTLSYTIDIYKNRLSPTKDFISFAAFVSFFPQLVAGPIERAKNLLPQFYRPRQFDYSQGVDGLRQILWGLFKKVVIADNCAIYVNYIFDNSLDLSGSTLFLGAILFTFQIYGDFSGYSDIAIGVARLFGFNLMQNFAFPFFARDIPEFWRRWHISLTTWFRDYVYIPLVKRGSNKILRIRNIFILFILTGLWHGANWTFIAWGCLNALYFLPFLLLKNVRSHTGIVASEANIPTVKEVLAMGATLTLNVLGIIFFRAENIQQAWSYISGIFSFSFFEIPYFVGIGYSRGLIFLIFFFMTVEWLGRRDKHALEKLVFIKSIYVKRLFYSLIVVLIGVFMFTEELEFIYFQF